MPGTYRSGKRRRRKLGPKEREQLLRLAYDDYSTGRVLDRSRLVRHIDYRARKLVEVYLDGPFQDEFVEYVAERQAAAERAQRERLARAGLLPVTVAPAAAVS